MSVNIVFSFKFKRRFILVSGGAVFLTLVSTSVTLADNSIGNIVSTFNQYYGQVEQYLSQMAQNADTSKVDIKQIVEKATGALGLPDPFEVANEVGKTISTSDWETGINPAVKAGQVQKQTQQQSSRQTSQWVLGKSGQDQMKQENNQTNQAMTNIDVATNTALQSITTQEIMRQIAEQNRQSAQIQQSVQAETQQTSRQIASANMNLTNISNTLDTQQRQKDEAANAEATSFMTQAAFDVQLWKNP